jgi:hypothetical protein
MSALKRYLVTQSTLRHEFYFVAANDVNEAEELFRKGMLHPFNPR